MSPVWRDCRRWLAGQVGHIARWIYRRGEHQEILEIRDEFGICRCRVQVASDEYIHGVSARDELPSDWDLRWYKDGERWQ